MSLAVSNFTAIAQHLMNLNPYQTVQPENFALLLVAFIAFVLVGIVLRHLIAIGIAVAILIILLAVAAGLKVSIGGVFSVGWALFSGLGTALATVMFASGVYSVIASICGLALGFFFTRA